jgi:hypothetical protein
MRSITSATHLAALTSFVRATSKAKRATLFLFSVAVLLAGGAAAVRGQSALDGFDPTPTLGNYPDTSVLLSIDTTVTPDATPTNTTSINVSTSTNFKGKLESYPTTGVVRVTDAHPAGTYTVRVRAFDGVVQTATKTFTLTVTTPATCPQVSFAVAGNFDVGYYPNSIAVGDFNGDGKQDLATANDLNVSILLGDGTGHFSAATNFDVGESHYSVVVGDFNGDGNQDLATANFGTGYVSIFLGDGTGHFSAATRYGPFGGPYSVAVGDFNGDGKQDLAVVRRDSSATVAILLGDGAGHFGTATSFGPGGNYAAIAVGDFNGDGNQDLAVVNEGSNNVSILFGDGAGHFSAATTFAVGTQPVSVAAGDFNGDGKQDLAVANYYSANVSILLGDGAGHFSAATNFVVGGGPLSVAVGDFNGDGKQDLAFANAVTNNASILLGDGAGHFGAPIYFGVGTNGGNPSSVAVGDFNGDGKQDLAVPAANYASQNVTILLRDCTAPTPTPTPSVTPLPTTHFAVSAPEYVAQGFSFYFWVTAKDQFNNTVTGYLGTVHFTSTGLAYLPPNCPLANGMGMFMATLNTLGYQTITATDTSDPSITGTSNPISVESEQPTPTPAHTPTPAATPTATPNPTATPGATSTPTPAASPTPTPGASPTPTPSPTPTTKAINLSTRMRVQTGDGVGIGGFIITGSTPKHVLIRGIGPSLVAFGITDALADPTLDLRASDGSRILANDNWRDTQQAEIEATGIPPTNDLEAAIVATLPPGSYTAILRGKFQGTGVGLVEIYDLNQGVDSILANLSTRAFVSTADNIVIAGFILGGSNGDDRIVVRGIGPSLTAFGVSNALADPTLELRDSNGALLIANNDWQDDPAQAAELTAAGLAPTNNLESAIAATLPPGLYTALLAGRAGGTGIGVIEIYDLGAP